MRHPLPTPPRAAIPRPLLAVLCLLLLAGAGWAAWLWRQQTRPGMVHYRLGVDAAVGHHFQAAEREWKLGITQDPTFPDCYERLGDLYREVRDYPNAIADYRAAARLRPRDGDLAKQLAAAFVAAGDDADALEPARHAYELLPEDADAAGTYGDLAQKGHNPGLALPPLLRAHRLDPANPRYALELASVQMDLSHFGDGERLLTEFLSAHPADPWANYLMAVVYNQKPRTPDNVKTVLTYGERSLATGHAPINTYVLLAQLDLELGRVEDALKVSQAVLQRVPNDTDALSLLAKCDNRLGRPQEAERVSQRLRAIGTRHDRIEHLKMVMRFDNRDITHGLELARLQEEDGDLTDAESYYVALVREAPHDPRTHPALAAFLRHTGRLALAQRAADPGFVP